jgi:hypothetical protein
MGGIPDVSAEQIYGVILPSPRIVGIVVKTSNCIVEIA